MGHASIAMAQTRDQQCALCTIDVDYSSLLCFLSVVSIHTDIQSETDRRIGFFSEVQCTRITKCLLRSSNPPRNNWESTAQVWTGSDETCSAKANGQRPIDKRQGKRKRKRASHSPNATGLTTPSINMSANASDRSIVSTPQAESDGPSKGNTKFTKSGACSADIKAYRF